MISLLRGLWRRWVPRRRRSYALNDLDLKLQPYLDFDGGFFIEAGANDGLSQSNTLYFERYRGWTGLLIEPVPELAARCRKNRPRCVVESVALTPCSFAGDRIQMQYCNLMSLVAGAMRTPEEEAEHLRQGCACQRIKSYALTVPTSPLSALLDRHGIRRVDLLSLDVEGYELPALQGIEFERHRPQWMLIETRYRQAIDDYLQPLYEPVAELSYHDVLYRCRQPVPLENKARSA